MSIYSNINYYRHTIWDGLLQSMSGSPMAGTTMIGGQGITATVLVHRIC